MKLFPVFCFERCSGTKYENKKNTDFTEVSAFGVTSCSKISKFRNEKRPQLQSECFKIFNNTNINESLKFACELLEGIISQGAVKNIVLYSDGLPESGEWEEGRYSYTDCMINASIFINSFFSHYSQIIDFVS